MAVYWKIIPVVSYVISPFLVIFIEIVVGYIFYHKISNV